MINTLSYWDCPLFLSFVVVVVVVDFDDVMEEQRTSKLPVVVLT